MDHLRGKAIIASGFHTTRPGEIDFFQNALIAVGNDGAILSVHRPHEKGYAEEKEKHTGRLVSLPHGSYLLPGFVDLHVHAPQYPQLGSALDVPLEVWLQKYTFPLEARYADAAFARRSYRLLVDDLIANGTTTALYFATIHQEATRILADVCLEAGQRALIGKVVMDNADQCPDYYRDASSDAALRSTGDLIGYIRSHPDNTAGLVKPVVTPRFIPAPTQRLKRLARWQSNVIAMFRPIARKAIGNTAMCWSGMASPTPRALIVSGCSAATRCSRIPT
jgi:guanine deaminase